MAFRTPEETRELLKRLQRELPYLRRGEIPPGVDLDAAPLLDHWAYTIAPPDGLVGHCVDHPRLPPGPIVTSQLVWIDETRGLARTVSRYYRLGRPLGTASSQ